MTDEPMTESPAVQDTDRLRVLAVDARMPAYRAARGWAAQHGHPQPDDRMIAAALAAVLPVHREMIGREIFNALSEEIAWQREKYADDSDRAIAARLIGMEDAATTVRRLAVSAPSTLPGSPPADERATVVETGRGDTWPICWAKSRGMLCDRQAGHQGDHVDVYGPLPEHTWSSEPAAVPGTGDEPDWRTEPAGKHVAAVQRWMALDLWIALGAEPADFETKIGTSGWAETWATLLSSVRDGNTIRAALAAERDRLAELVGEEGQEGWDGCSRAEAIRQAMSFHASVMHWADEHDKRRDEREEQRERADRAAAECDRLALDLQARDIAVQAADRLREQVEAERDAARAEAIDLTDQLGDLRATVSGAEADRDRLAETIRRYEPVIEAAKAWLAYGWNGSARLTAGIEALGDIPSSQLPEVGEPGSTVGDGAQPPDIPSPTAPEAPLSQLDGAMHSIWLHGNWRWLTKNMTTPEKEATLAAVLRHDRAMKADEADLGGELLTEADWAWWREPARAEPEGTPDADT